VPGRRSSNTGVFQVVVDARTDQALPASSLKGQHVFAFCGIAGPQRFLAALMDLGADVAGSLVFPDHYKYRADSIRDQTRVRRFIGPIPRHDGEGCLEVHTLRPDPERNSRIR
jgi:hypothetical protein